MKTIPAALLCLAVFSAAAIDGGAQSAADPRVGLKAGFRDAGQAAWNMELVASLPKPEGFFDPSAPAGSPTPAERPRADTDPPEPNPNTVGPDAAAPDDAATNPATGQPRRAVFDPKVANRLSFTNSDIAFAGNRLFAGNYHGFNVYDIENRGDPRLVASVVCPGGQGDVSVYRNLLFMSVEQVRGRVDCGTQGVQTEISDERFRGVRIFDISDLGHVKQIAAVQTCRGSHTHTLVVDPDDGANVYIYGAGTGTARSAAELAGCSGLKPEEDPNTSLYSIDVIQVPLADPAQARIVNRPRVFADTATGSIAGLWQGGNHGPGSQTSRATTSCHDVTVFPEVGLAAGACGGNGILLDIADPVNPVRLDHVVDKSFAYWHSATFNNSGTKVLFTDEWGGGTRPRCRAADPPTWGADAIFDIVDRKLRFGGYYKMLAAQTDQENCVAHNGSLIPVPGRDIMAQAWYQGGISVFDFTDSSRPIEIAFFDRGPIDGARLMSGGFWSAYWYNGSIYGTEMARGIDVFRLTPSAHLSQNEIAAAVLAHAQGFNPQQQTRFTWPASPLVAQAYLDQLARSKVLAQTRIAEIRDGLRRLDSLQTGRERNARELVDRLQALAGQLEKDASARDGRDAERLRGVADVIRTRIAALRPA
jgi:hypothetical protein